MLEPIEVNFTIHPQLILDCLAPLVDIVYWIVVAYGCVWMLGWSIGKGIKKYELRVKRKIRYSDFGRIVKSGLRNGGWTCQGGGCRDEHGVRKWRYTNGEGKHQRIIVVKTYPNGYIELETFFGVWTRLDNKSRHGRHVINWTFDNLSIDI
ncbi:hypothetical protein VPHK397_0170 [Vibrio phage K397]|nr:hypothetical protein MYOV002v2_p0160 [Vibrio phage 144E46.1]